MQETPVQFLGWEDPLERDRLPTPVFLGCPYGSAGQESACMWQTWVLSLGWENLLEKGKVTHSSDSENINFLALSLLYGPALHIHTCLLKKP